MLPALRNNASLTRNGGYTPTNRLASWFDHFFADDFFAPLISPAWDALLPLSMWQDEDHLYVEADVPGLNEQDIELAVHDGTLTLKGERKCERKGTLYEGRTYGRFEQRVTLPADVDPNGVEAKLANGVLTVTLPKRQESKPRKIAIKEE